MMLSGITFKQAFTDTGDWLEVDYRGHYIGMIGKKHGKWATSWNAVFDDPEKFRFTEQDDAVQVLVDQYRRIHSGL
jgi:hypothetical protein